MARRLDHLTGLCGIAAYLVLIANAMANSMAGTPLTTPALDGISVQLAYFGMSVFFVLSGFVIHYNYIDAFKTRPFLDATRYFFAARFARLCPLYGLAILLNVLYQPTGTFLGRPGAAAAYLTRTASWFNLEQLIPKLRSDDSYYPTLCGDDRFVNVTQIKYLGGYSKPAATPQVGRG
jgi:peptidoglycan/LPS O-acetylase OafA/YrhL